MNPAGGRLISAIVSDSLNLLVPTGGSIAGLAVERLWARRLNSARDILLEELKSGSKTLFDPDVEEVVAIIYRYSRAAQEGAARRNLHLLAQVIAGQCISSNIIADAFLYYADILSTLRREEIILLGNFHRNLIAEIEQGAEEGDAVRKALMSAEAELVGRVFRSAEEVQATLSALTRTGLIMPTGTFGGVGYGPTPLFTDLAHRVSFQRAAEYGDSEPMT